MANVTLKNGKFIGAFMHNGHRQSRSFDTRKAASDWVGATRTAAIAASGPHLGGPKAVTLARALLDYARLFTVQKKSAKSELDRINRYLVADGLPAVELVDNGDGTSSLRTRANKPAPVPKSFKALRDERLDKHCATNARREQLARTKMSDLTPVAFQSFIAEAKLDGLKNNTMRLEMALLKHAFGQMEETWGWVTFRSPLKKVKSPKPGPAREVLLPADAQAQLVEALRQSTNPFVAPFVELALETSARRGSLMKLCWSDIDTGARTMRLFDTKSGQNVFPSLSQRALAILASVPRIAHEKRVFPITDEALNAAWDRACEAVGLEDFVFHDTRHVATTMLAKRLRNLEALKQMTGHRTYAMLARYLTVMHEDTVEALDRTEPQAPAIDAPAPIAPEATTEAIQAQRRRESQLRGREARNCATVQDTPPSPVEPARPDQTTLPPEAGHENSRATDTPVMARHSAVIVPFDLQRRRKRETVTPVLSMAGVTASGRSPVVPHAIRLALGSVELGTLRGALAKVKRVIADRTY